MDWQGLSSALHSNDFEMTDTLTGKNLLFMKEQIHFWGEYYPRLWQKLVTIGLEVMSPHPFLSIPFHCLITDLC